MKFPGYVVSTLEGKVAISRVEIDETELTPESDWMQGYQNEDPNSGVWLGRDLEAALIEVRKRLSS